MFERLEQKSKVIDIASHLGKLTGTWPLSIFRPFEIVLQRSYKQFLILVNQQDQFIWIGIFLRTVRIALHVWNLLVLCLKAEIEGFSFFLLIVLCLWETYVTISSPGLVIVDCSASTETVKILSSVVDHGCCIVLANKKPLTSSMVRCVWHLMNARNSGAIIVSTLHSSH